MKKPLRVGMIGYGFMGKAHSNAYRKVNNFFPDLEYRPVLKALCARNEEKARLEKAEQDARSRRTKEKGKGKQTDTRYGRKELHVAGDKSGRRRRKTPIRRRPKKARPR